MKVSLHQLHLCPVLSLPSPGDLDHPAPPAEVALDLLYGLVPGLGDEHRREDPAQGADAPVQPECAVKSKIVIPNMPSPLCQLCQFL